MFTSGFRLTDWKWVLQCRSKGNISGGACERRRREPLGGLGVCPPHKILKSKGLEMLFPAFSKSYLWFKHIANYLLCTLLRILSQQPNGHWEYITWNVNYKIENRLFLYLENSKCFTFQSHHSKFFVYLTVWVALETNVDFIGRSSFENFPNSCLIIFYFQHFIQVCFYFFGKKTGGGTGPPAPPLATALIKQYLNGQLVERHNLTISVFLYSANRVKHCR